MAPITRYFWRAAIALVVAFLVVQFTSPTLVHAIPPIVRPLAWGYNGNGQLGNNSVTDSRVPEAVDTSGVLNGKTITAIVAGDTSSLALDSTGHVYAWGWNANGELGNNSNTDSYVPVAVDTSGVLNGKIIIAIATAGGHNVVLDSTGRVYAWGDNADGQLGNNSTTYSPIPVVVDTTGVLSGKTITAISAAGYHNLVLDSAGHIYSWGQNSEGELGNNSATRSLVPVAVDTTGVLSGTTITAIAVSLYHSLALDSTGHVYAWGWNPYGQLGNNSTTQSLVPVAVDTTGVLHNKIITALASGRFHSLALDSTGTLYAWGWNAYGQLGNNSTTTSLVPTIVHLPANTAATTLGSSPLALHTLILAQTVTALSYTTQPSGGMAGFAFDTQPVFTVYDSFGQVATQFNGNVTVAIKNGSGVTGATLSGTTTVAAINGVATFTDLSIDKAGTGYLLTATSTGLSTAESSPLSITPGAAATLAYTLQPSGGVAGVAFDVQPVVQTYDALGNVATAFSGNITLAIKNGSGSAGATLSGTVTLPAANGVATFTGLSIDTVGTGYFLTATSIGLTSVDSHAFAVVVPVVKMQLRTSAAAIKAAKGKQYITTLTVTNNTGTMLPAGTTLHYSLSHLQFKTIAVALSGGATVTNAVAPKGKTLGTITATLDSTLADGATLNLTLTITAHATVQTYLSATLGAFSSNAVAGIKTDGSSKSVTGKLKKGNATAIFSFFAANEPLAISVQPSVNGAPTSAIADSNGSYVLALTELTVKSLYTVTIVGAWSGITGTYTFKAR